jgi:hypothetical protein
MEIAKKGERDKKGQKGQKGRKTPICHFRPFSPFLLSAKITRENNAMTARFIPPHGGYESLLSIFSEGENCI